MSSASNRGSILYRTIVVDPPWEMPSGGAYRGTARYQKRPSALPYPTLSHAEIASLPVVDLAAPEAHLYLWAPNAHLRPAYEIVETWGFRPSQVLVWCKSPRGLGLGGAFTNTTEFVLFARRGVLAAEKRMDSTWFHWTRPHNNHSAKPEGFLDLVEQVSPGPYLELFARRQRLGWDTWGNEALEHVEFHPMQLADPDTEPDFDYAATQERGRRLLEESKGGL